MELTPHGPATAVVLEAVFDVDVCLDSSDHSA
jgi:hypothetical protein